MNDRTSNRDLMRYGIKWNGPREPIGTPMEDGYWTPWHLAQGEIDRLSDELQRARIQLAQAALEALSTIGKVLIPSETSEPPEPTPDMIKQGIWAWERTGSRSVADDVRAIYVAMRRMEMRTVEPTQSREPTAFEDFVDSLPVKASACTCEQDDCPHDAPEDRCCGKCRGALNGKGNKT